MLLMENGVNLGLRDREPFIFNFLMMIIFIYILINKLFKKYIKPLILERFYIIIKNTYYSKNEK